MSICILADAADIDRAKSIELEYMSVDDLKKCVAPHSSSPYIHPHPQTQQEQKARQEACQEIRRFPCVRDSHQADPSSPWPRSFQGSVPFILRFFRPLSEPTLAGKFPTPISHAEDLSNKLTEVRSTIKFQLKKVCLHDNNLALSY
jgi:large subunit ribosomal protein L10Ae